MRYFVFFCLALTRLLQADWNHDFEAQSQETINKISGLQTSKYLNERASFLQVSSRLLKDSFLKKEIKNSDPNQKLRIINVKDRLVLKKRPNNNIKECYVFELAHIMQGSEFFVPSFPLEIGGQQVVVQNMEAFAIAEKGTRLHRPEYLEMVSLETYWKAHLIAYLLGLRDLVGQNIGINSRGNIRFFDVEDSFFYEDQPIKEPSYFRMSFLTQAMDWPQYRGRIDARLAAKLSDFVSQLSYLEPDILEYLSARKLDVRVEGLQYRLNKVRGFHIEEGCSFRDLYGFLFPKMNPGLEEIRIMISHMIKRRVDHGGALFYATGKHKIRGMTPSQKKQIRRWIEKYVD